MASLKTEPTASEIKIVHTGCCHDCGGRCALKAHVKDGVIVRIETDDGTEPQYRACARGRAYRQRVYHPDRLKYPLKRVGERGEGRFVRISWDEALESVAGELKRVKETYGPSAILFLAGSGNQGSIHGGLRIGELLLHHGGYTQGWGGASFEGSLFASMATYGTISTGDSRDNLLHSKLIILWGWNPASTIWDTNTSLYLAKAKEAGIRIIGVDPIYTDTIATFAQQWVPIRPGSDAAALIAMAYVLISENRQDQAFLDRYTVGFAQYRDYVLGVADGIPKTPQWAEGITGVPAATIEGLAREYATTKPAALIAGWAPGRSAMGEQYHRAAIVLAAMTGNVGIAGGNAAGFERAYSSRERRGPRAPRNPVEVAAPPRRYSLHQLHGGTNATSARIHQTKIFDAILRGRAGGYPADLKMAYIVAGNPLNSRLHSNKGAKALRQLEFIVVHDQFMTPTAKFADVVLPVNTFMERNDVAVPWLGAPYYIFLNKAIDSLYESKSDHEIAVELSKRLDAPGYVIRSEEELIKAFAASRDDIDADGYETLRRDGILKLKYDPPIISFRKQIEDPDNHPFATPSGKIEIYSDLLAQMNDPLVPPVPKYIAAWEGRSDLLAENYPLQYVTIHFKRQTHSTLDMVPWLREIEAQTVMMNAADAAARGIKNGDPVRVFNDRGQMRMPAKVTERMMPGVVAVGEGAYFAPDDQGVDRGGGANTATKDEHSPGGAFATNTTLVQVERAEKGVS